MVLHHRLDDGAKSGCGFEFLSAGGELQLGIEIGALLLFLQGAFAGIGYPVEMLLDEILDSLLRQPNRRRNMHIAILNDAH